MEFHGPSSVLFDEDVPNRRQDKELTGGQHHLDPIYTVSNFSRLCRLSLIMNKVLNEIYRENKKS